MENQWISIAISFGICQIKWGSNNRLVDNLSMFDVLEVLKKSKMVKKRA